MDNQTIVSRRALLKGAPAVAVAATALPVAPAIADAQALHGLPLAAVHIESAIEAMADPAVWGEWSVTIHGGDANQNWSFQRNFNEVRRAISLHEHLRAAYDALLEREDEIEKALETHPTYEARPKVQYGWLLNGATSDGRTPLYASTIRQLDDHCASDCGSVNAIWGEKGVARTVERYAGLKKDLARRLRRRAAIEGATGLARVRREKLVTIRDEERAAVAVLLAKPRDGAEAAEKRRYIAANECFDAYWWDAGGLMAALRANLGLEA